MKDGNLTVSEEAWGLKAFNDILKRDKTKGKSKALSEMLFVWYWCDIKSNYIIMDEDTRLIELKKDITNLPTNFEIDDTIKAAIELYSSHETIVQRLYRKSIRSADAVGNYLDNTAALLAERDKSDKPVNKIGDITKGLKDIKFIIKELKETEKEVIKEQLDSSNKKKGSRSFNLFEEGL